MSGGDHRSREVERLAALRGYGILDSPQEPSFDGITSLLARVLDVPIALLTLADHDRLWFKSRVGLDATETARPGSMCTVVVDSGAPLAVPDATLDPRFATSPLVTGAPHIRFYLGAPLCTRTGFVIGSLCAIDRVPREVSDRDLVAIELLAAQAVTLLELRRAEHELTNERATVTALQAQLEQAAQAGAARETALVEDGARMQRLFDGLGEGVVEQDRDGHIIACNTAAEALLGLTRAQMAGRTSIDPRWQAIHDDGAPFPGADHPAMVTLRTGRPATGVIMGVLKPSGERTWLSVDTQPLFGAADDRPRAVIATFRDVTAQREAARQAEHLHRRERLMATGALAAGVGHEINNPLSYIVANLDLALEELRGLIAVAPRAVGSLIEVLSDAREGSERIRGILRGLRALVRADAAPVPTAVPAVVDAALQVAMHHVRPRATVTTDLTRAAPVMADEPRLTQVLINLLVNAAQAFTTDTPTANRIEIRAAVVGDQLELAVADNGPGIAPDVLPRIYDPFFTTRPVGQGSGLGLSICHSIVLSLDGTLTCDSELGRGTTFRIRLPLAPAVASPTPAEAPRSRRGHVMVVDDDPTVLRAITRALQHDHEVVAHADPRAAWSAIDGGVWFDVVFCDLMMPNLTGAELFRMVETRAPAQADRFVFVTGGVLRADLNQFLDRVANERLEKPFSLQNIRGIARRLVDTPRG